ncbi:hypothetical protein D9C73_006949 [Collichthys lucidus]|uniref:Uncharacterized protein n=1 Tax=Collichthys lucidus TaxID=240159 RepID=A0A4V6APU0_COLLU|nr:hypothetical protein D9C73_006949 [Collichthys lucidus]
MMSNELPHRRVTFSTANQSQDLQDASQHSYYDSGLEESETPSSKSSSGPRIGPLALPEDHYERTTPDGSIGEMEHPENGCKKTAESSPDELLSSCLVSRRIGPFTLPALDRLPYKRPLVSDSSSGILTPFFSHPSSISFFSSSTTSFSLHWRNDRAASFSFIISIEVPLSKALNPHNAPVELLSAR